MLAALSAHPIVVAPMGGGPSTPRLVAAAADAGAIGFLAAGYKTAAQVEQEINEVRATTTGPFGVNLFIPGAPFPDRDVLDRYLRSLAPEAAALDVELGPASWDDDGWSSKSELIVEMAPPLVSFTFGCPPPALVSALQDRGSLVVVTITSPDEARTAEAVGADLLCAQGVEAGAHRGSFTNEPRNDARALGTIDLMAAVQHVTSTPTIAAGGIALPEHVTTVLRMGAVAAQAGTAFLRSNESGAHPLHKSALVDPTFETTALTRCYSGRLARGLVNRMMRDHPDAPAAYPEINNATRPLRSAAAAKADTDSMSLWAGTGHRHAREATVADIIHFLTNAN